MYPADAYEIQRSWGIPNSSVIKVMRKFHVSHDVQPITYRMLCQCQIPLIVISLPPLGLDKHKLPQQLDMTSKPRYDLNRFLPKVAASISSLVFSKDTVRRDIGYMDLQQSRPTLEVLSSPINVVLSQKLMARNNHIN